LEVEGAVASKGVIVGDAFASSIDGDECPVGVGDVDGDEDEVALGDGSVGA
jgi:hypothetical protein